MRALPLFRAAILAGVSAFSIPLCVSRADVPAQPATVLVLPFAVPSGSKDDWVGKAVQQDLLTDLIQGTITRVLAPADAPAAVDPELAVKTAHDQGASIVVFGQAQVVGTEIRLTGQVVDIDTGKPLGGLKATGPSDQLFHLEDALAGQVFVAMPKTLLTAQTLQGIQQSGPNPAQRAPTPARDVLPSGVYPMPGNVSPPDVYSPQSYYSYPNYSYNYYQTPDDSAYYPAYTYAYPDLGYWPYWDSGVIIGGFGFDHYHHDHGGFHHWGDANRGSNSGRGLTSAGRGFVGAETAFGTSGATRFAPARSGFGSTGFARAGSGPRISSGGMHAGVSRGASIGGFHGGFSGGSRSGGGFHGGGGHR